MAGFTLPKLRWLVLGAVAAGLWAMTQDIPRQNEPAKQPRREATVKAPPQRLAQTPEPKRLRTVSTDRSEKTASIDRSEKVMTPARIEPPQPRPSEMTTSSIPRPSKPVGPTAQTEKLYTTSRVRLREKADLKAGVVTTLKRGEVLSHLSRKGKWHLVSVGGQKGWVHGDFVSEALPRADVATVEPAPRPRKVEPAQRPKKTVARTEPAAPRKQSASVAGKPDPVPVADTTALSSNWGGMRPARAPQGGDCQCPYDLMLSGKQCGDHSAYSRGIGAPQCYF